MIFSLNVEKRDAGHASADRSAGSIPGVVYGPQMTAAAIAVPYHEFEILYRNAGKSSLIDFTIGGKEPVKVLVQDVQYDPVSGRVIHVDFRQINMNKPMTADAELRFIGESPAVKGLGGTLIKALSYVTLSCLPKDLVSHLDVDISRLATFDDTIRLSDLAIPAGITIVDALDTTVAKVAAPLTEDQLKAMEEGTGPKSLEDIEVEEKGKKEEEEGAEAGEDQAAAPEEKK